MAEPRTLYEPSTEHDACGFGFVCDIAGRPSHAIVRDALTVLVNLEHRGASGSQRNTGDGAGILTGIPRSFLRAAARDAALDLPAGGGSGVAMVFLPRDAASRTACTAQIERTLADEGLTLLGWRDVPTDTTGLGETACASRPAIRQAFVARPADLGPGEAADLDFERRLYVARRLIEKSVQRSAHPGRGEFYVPSMSCRTIVYKGMLNASQLLTFYPDLLDPRYESAVALVHSRFSTNTFPSWARAHPYRYISHNGEINTLRGNVNWMFARQSSLRSEVFGEDLPKVLPAVDVDGSDTAIFDNVLELLHLSGRSLAHVMAMMVPEPWSRDPSMSPARKAFYQYHACLMEPWDGPASLAFTDGIRIGATLDRNGLRPGRYYVTRDGRVIMASEAGVLDIPAAEVVAKGRLQPGRMFLVDMAEGRIVGDDELKDVLAAAKPYEQLVAGFMTRLEDLPHPAHVHEPDHESVIRRQEVFGYTAEDVRMIINPMAESGFDPVGSMGNDAPLAVLSERPQLLFNYFKQLFAQVTNPPVDAIREEIIMATERSIGPEDNLLEPGDDAAHQLAIPSPVISNTELAKIRALDGGPTSFGFRTITLPILFKVAENGTGLRRAIEDLRQRASEAIEEGYNQVLLSDRGHDAIDAPIPALLAVSAVHHHLVRAGTRGRVGLIIESGEPREAHHYCLLIGYGASAINPYLAFETIDDQVRLGIIAGPTAEAEQRYRTAAVKGVIKAISRMGISTVHSYHGAQVFEAIGLNRDFVDEYFTWTASRIGGIGIEVVSREVQLRQQRAYPPKRPIVHRQPPPGGQYKYRTDGEHHLFNPLTIHTLQKAVRAGDYSTFKDYTALVDDQSNRLATLRGLLELRPALRPVPIDEVEPVESIVR
ncbi:MAG: glutamate synthase subunit alpha, partial [Chloroflexi bacterium]|nr:glutamate synthase subunit alpha [Chloroflexota bacterium]